MILLAPPTKAHGYGYVFRTVDDLLDDFERDVDNWRVG
jgi:hypothetical protein